MTDIEKIRLKIGDRTEPYQFENTDLQSFLTDEGSVNLASAAALEAWAAAYAASPASETIGGYAYTQSITKNMLDMAAKLKDAESTTPAMAWAEPDLMGTDEGNT